MSGRVEESLVLDEEIAWLRSFGWNDHAIARRLRVTVEAIEQRDRRRWVA